MSYGDRIFIGAMLVMLAVISMALIWMSVDQRQRIEALEEAQAVVLAAQADATANAHYAEQERERHVASGAPKAGPAEPPRQAEMDAPAPQALGHGDSEAALSPLPTEPRFTAAREPFWVPSEAILLHVYRCESPGAGLYDEERDLLQVDPQIVHEAWIRDGGLRAALARFCELVELGSQAWGSGRQDVVEALERDRVAAVAELWLFYSPAAYAAFVEAQER